MEELFQDDVLMGISLQGNAFFSRKYRFFRKLHQNFFYGQVIMRQNWLFAVTLIITGSAMLLLSGCQEQNQVKQQPKTAEAKGAPTAFEEQNRVKQQPKTAAKNATELRNEPNALAPKIKFDETSVDFGKTGPGMIVTKDLKFQNIGKGILKISEILQCCGIFAKVDKEQYEPGEKGILTIEFHSTGNIGLLERNPVVYSNDPENPQITLYVRAEIEQIVVWEPGNIKLFLNEENAACPKVKIESLDNQPFAITGIRSTGNCITAEYNPLVKKTEHVLDLKVDLKKLPDQLYGQIDISMDHPNGNFANIPFNIVPKYNLSPKPLYLFDMKENEPRKEKIKLINNYKKDIKIVSTSSKENTIRMIDYNKINDDYEINVEITPPPATKGELRFNDIFYINLDDGEQLALNCMGYYKTE